MESSTQIIPVYTSNLKRKQAGDSAATSSSAELKNIVKLCLNAHCRVKFMESELDLNSSD